MKDIIIDCGFSTGYVFDNSDPIDKSNIDSLILGQDKEKQAIVFADSESDMYMTISNVEVKRCYPSNGAGVYYLKSISGKVVFEDLLSNYENNAGALAGILYCYACESIFTNANTHGNYA